MAKKRMTLAKWMRSHSTSPPSTCVLFKCPKSNPNSLSRYESFSPSPESAKCRIHIEDLSMQKICIKMLTSVCRSSSFCQSFREQTSSGLFQPWYHFKRKLHGNQLLHYKDIWSNRQTNLISRFHLLHRLPQAAQPFHKPKIAIPNPSKVVWSR